MRLNIVSNCLLQLINLYQKYLWRFNRSSCLYSPSCSSYAIEAIQKYGAIKGSLLAIQRISRCRPSAKGGDDPVI